MSSLFHHQSTQHILILSNDKCANININKQTKILGSTEIYYTDHSYYN